MFVGTVRPVVTYMFVLELLFINLGLGWEVASNGKSVLTLEPEAAYSTLLVYEEAGIFGTLTNNVRLLDLGLRLGVTF